MTKTTPPPFRFKLKKTQPVFYQYVRIRQPKGFEYRLILWQFGITGQLVAVQIDRSLTIDDMCINEFVESTPITSFKELSRLVGFEVNA